jgi:hypothetical protein
MRQVIEVRRRRARRCLPPIAAGSVLLLCAIATAKGQGPEVKVIEIDVKIEGLETHPLSEAS